MRDDADPSILRRVHRTAAIHIHRATERLGRELAASSRDSLEESLRGLSQMVGRLHGHSGALDDDTTFRSIVAARRSQIEAARTHAVNSLRQRIESRVLDRMTQMVAEDYTIGQVVAAIDEEMEANWWQVERIVRTESSYAYNTAQVDGIRTIAKDFPGMLMRWTELIDDSTGLPFDNRVAADSFAMHGQVASIGGVFTMPHPTSGSPRRAAGVSDKLIGRSWSHPPNRPNDRAVLTPWMRDWGIPAWKFQAGRRITLR